MNKTLFTILVILNIPSYYFIGKLFYKSKEDFFEAIRFWFTPDIISLFRGELLDDFWEGIKLGFFLTVCSAVVYAQYQIFS